MIKIIILFFTFNISIFCKANIVEDEIKCLRDMPMTELLKIQKSLNNFQCEKNNNNDITAASEEVIEDDEIIESRTLNEDDKIHALPLINLKNFFQTNKKIIPAQPQESERSDETWDNDKPTKMRQIFEGSITALSFLAFGAYLLCMIVQAIKSKGITYYHPVATVSPLTNSSPIKRIKVIRRTKRSNKNQNLSRKFKTPAVNFEKSANNSQTESRRRYKYSNMDEMGLPDPQDMYNVLVQFAEGYVKIATI